MVADPMFVDTNVLVYANQKRSAFHTEAVALLERAGRDTALWISRQVLREYLATVTRPQGSEPALPMAAALQRVRNFAVRFEVAEDGPEVFDKLLELLARVRVAGKQVHDANLVATMLAHGIKRLLTFNVSDFQRFGAVIELVAP
jgi:predicted nucleic acid-binding protein